MFKKWGTINIFINITYNITVLLHKVIQSCNFGIIKIDILLCTW